MKSKIIPGYNGIIPLDLTHVDPKYHKEMIRVHLNDIEHIKRSKVNYQKDYDMKIASYVFKNN